MNNLDKILRILFDRYNDATMGNLLIFHIGLCFVALIIDKMLLDTFPAITLIGIIILLTSISNKMYTGYLINKNRKNRH